MTDRSDARTADSIQVLSRCYHTENGNIHPEGEVYTVTDVALAETLYGIGFATKAPPGEEIIDPPPEDGGTRRRSRFS